MPTITGTSGNDILTGTSAADTINPLVGRDSVDGLGDSDTLIVDYSSVAVDPYAGASPANVPSTVTSSGGSFNGAIRAVDNSNYVTFANIEHLQIKLDFWHNTFTLDGSALTQGATIVLDGGVGTDTLDADLSALASVNLTYDAGGVAASFGTIISFEVFKLTLTNGADTVTTGAGADVLRGNDGDDVLNSGGGNDILTGGGGFNTLNAGDGDDWITSSGVDTVDGGSGGFNYDRWMGEYGSSSSNLIFTRDRAAGTASLSNGTTLTNIEQVMYLTTGSGNDVFTFTESEAITITAGAGEDTLNLTGYSYAGDIVADGAGAFQGNLGNDRFTGIEHLNFVSDSRVDTIAVNAAPLLAGATLSLNAAGGSDLLTIDFSAFGSSISFVHEANGSVTTNTGAAISNFETYQVTSGAGADVITTAGGNDLLDGGSGADAMTGGSGNDAYVVDNAGDTVIENAGEGVDEIRTGLASFSLAALAHVENLKGTSASGQSLIGNDLANAISGGSGNDLIAGGAGADTMAGGLGNDTYYVDNAGDFVAEIGGQGTDRVATSVGYALAAGWEVEQLEAINSAATDAMDLTGNELANTITGNAGVNVLRGEGGSDILAGLNGNDYLVGGTGLDFMYGGQGDDTYYIDSAGDQANEAAGEGTDRIATSVSYALLANSEIELLEGLNTTDTNALNLTGSNFANLVIGNNGVNTLRGEGGNDTLVGLNGNDFLVGGTGADLMYGGTGDDTYYVDDLGDQANEASGEGTDRIATSISFALQATSEVELLETVNTTDTNAMDLTGSNFANAIIGSDGVNVLRGEGGNDTLTALGGDDFLVGGAGNDAMFGNSGNDTYYVDSAGDTVTETAGQGNDRIATSVSYTLAAGSEVETLEAITRADTSAMNLTGNGTANTIVGNDGANTLDGKGGSDLLVGYGGADTFAFTTALGAGNVDHVADFVSGSDKIGLDDAVFTGFGLGAIGANVFVTGTAAQDADDRIIYDSATGNLFFDADGNGAGAAILFATLDGHPALNAGDFVVI